MSELSQAILIALFLAFAIGMVVFSYGRSHAILQSWAARNGFEIIEKRQPLFWRGPFFWTSGKGQAVFRVTVRDQQGVMRSGWVRVGHWLVGMLSDDAAVIWD